MELTEIGIIVSLCLGVYGAILSTYNLYQKRQENKPKIVVDSDIWFDETCNKADLFYIIVARNIGLKPVTLDYCYIEEYSDKAKIDGKGPLRTSSDLSINGKQIMSGQCIEVKYRHPYDFDPILDPYQNNSKKNVIGIFVDQIGNKYKSKPFQIE
jgi:hypothetical protein